ncbi:MAG: protein kinase, partial [Planctomycetaceae bacterium]
LEAITVDRGFEENSHLFDAFLTHNPDQFDWPLIGETVMGYRLLEPLGAGGFSRVYLADDPKVPDRKVALKLCRQEMHEASNLANLNHRAIGVVHDVTRDDKRGLGIISMQYRSRTTALSVISKLWSDSRPTSAAAVWDVIRTANRFEGEVTEWSRNSFTDWVLDVAIELARGLEESHKHGILHCDLKPANVVIDREGRPILVDFNVAFRQDAAAGSANVGGTLPYMAPEQIRAFFARSSSGLEPATDLYGLGVTLYELLTGRLPFESVGGMDAGIGDLLRARRTRACPLRSSNPDIDIELDRIILDCVSYDPLDRPRTAAGLADGLERIRTRRLVEQTETGSRGRTRWGSVAAAFALAVVAGLAIHEERPQLNRPVQAEFNTELTAGFTLLDNAEWGAAADQFAGVLESDSRNRVAVVGLYRARVQLQIARGGAEEILGIVNGKLTPELASFVGYLLAVNGQCEEAVSRLQYARRQGVSNEALLVNLGYALHASGRNAEAVDVLEEVRQQYGEHEIANVLLVKAVQNRDTLTGGISLADAEALMTPLPPSALRFRTLSEVYLMSALVARGRLKDPELARNYCDRSVELMKEACRRGMDLRYWNNIRPLLPEAVAARNQEFFKDAGLEMALRDGRECTMDPLTGWNLEDIRKTVVDHVQRPIVMSSRQ